MTQTSNEHDIGLRCYGNITHTLIHWQEIFSDRIKTLFGIACLFHAFVLRLKTHE